MTSVLQNPNFSLTNSYWKAVEIDFTKAEQLANEMSISLIVAQCLVARGITTLELAQTFLSPSLTNIPDPTGMQNLPEAIQVVTSALSRKEKIRIVGDYDCDGTTGLITLLNVFRLVSSDVDDLISCYVPDREKDGYGLNPTIIERAANDNIKVLISVDIGITAHREWEMARERGITGICLDHHTVLGSAAPKDALVVCPKQLGCTYEEKDLAACGLSLQFGRALLANNSKNDQIIESLTKLAAIGTVADLVPLSSPANRAIVSYGLRGLSSGSSNHGLRALLEVSGLYGKSINAFDLGFRLGPRINAAGRIDGSTISVVKLFDSKNPIDAQSLATQIDNWNIQRQGIQQNLVEMLAQAVESQCTGDSIYVLSGTHDEGWHQGVVGIAASKIVEQYHHPALVCSIRGDTAHGSARSIPQFNIVRALENIQDGLFHRFGGHAAAAGFSLPTKNIPELRKRINEYAAQTLMSDDFIPVRYYDGEIPLNQLTIDLIEELKQLEPYGMGNPAPRLVITGQVVEIRIIKEHHLKLRITDGSNNIEAIWWRKAPLSKDIQYGSTIKILGRPEINKWNNSSTIQIIVEDIKH